MGTCWGDIEEGVRIEVPNSDSNLSTKVYWIAEIIKLAGRTMKKQTNKQKHTQIHVYKHFKITRIDQSALQSESTNNKYGSRWTDSHE